MSKVVFVNRFYAPDASATSQLLSDLAPELVRSGLDVTVITSRQDYTDPSRQYPASEHLDGVNVVRVWSTHFGRGKLVGRAIDYLSFYLTALWAMLVHARAGDYLVAKTDPPMISVLAMLVAVVRRARLINWVQDLFPEVAVVLQPKMLPGWVFGLMQAVRNVSLRKAYANVCLGTLMVDRLIQQGVKPDRIRCIPNWVVGKDMQPVPTADNALRKEWGLEGKFVVGYSGNLGRAHEFGTILEAAKLLKEVPEVVFLFIGAGAQLAPVKEFVQKHQLSNFIFQPYQSLDVLASSLSAADLHLVSLQPELEGLIVPSKFYGIVAVGRPMVFIGDSQGELGRVLNESNSGVTVSPGDAVAMADFVRHCLADAASYELLASNSRRLGVERYNRSGSLGLWKNVFGVGPHEVGS